MPGGARDTEVNEMSGIEDSLGGIKSLGFGKLIVSLLNCVTCCSCSYHFPVHILWALLHV